MKETLCFTFQYKITQKLHEKDILDTKYKIKYTQKLYFKNCFLHNDTIIIVFLLEGNKINSLQHSKRKIKKYLREKIQVNHSIESIVPHIHPVYIPGPSGALHPPPPPPNTDTIPYAQVVEAVES